MKKKISIILIFVVTVSFIFFSYNFSPKKIEERKIVSYLDALTLEEKIGQLFIIRPEALCSTLEDSDTNSITCYKLTEQMIENYNKYPCGGFILFNNNLENEEQLKTFTNSLHSLSKVTPLISIDEEGGSVARIANHPDFNVYKFPNMANIQTSDEAYNVGFTIGSYLKDFGIDLDFAPVADINTNPNNKVIGERAFSNNPYIANSMVQSVIFGLHDKGIFTCIKHFPGHGDTFTDTHFNNAYTNKAWDELLNNELIPFVAGILAESDMIMASHISAPNITGDNLPASLSYTLLTEKLRNELKYDGIIITDSFEMSAITNNYDSATAAINSIKAGVDIILLPENYKEAYDGLLNAVKSGEISEDRINESIKRIIKLKNIDGIQ